RRAVKCESDAPAVHAAVAEQGLGGQRRVWTGQMREATVRIESRRTPARRAGGPPPGEKVKNPIPYGFPVNRLYLQARQNRTWRFCRPLPGLGTHPVSV